MPDASGGSSAGAMDPKAILSARFMAMLLQEVILDVAIKAHGRVSAERRRSALASASKAGSSSSQASPQAHGNINGSGGEHDKEPGQVTADSEADGVKPMDIDKPDAQSIEATTEASGGAESKPATQTEESLCAKCGKADCVGASGAVDCPDATASQGSSASAGITAVPTATKPTLSIPTIKPDHYSNNPLFECLVCSRQVSSNRYAGHLANCLGIGAKAASSRKVANRGQKIANILENRRKATALVPGSDMFVSSIGGGSAAAVPLPGGLGEGAAGGGGGGGSGTRAGTPAGVAARAMSVAASRQSTPAAPDGGGKAGGGAGEDVAG